MTGHLEIVVTGVQDDTDVVDVRVEVVEKLPVVDVGQLVAGLEIQLERHSGSEGLTHCEEILADFVDGGGFLHPDIHHVWLVSWIVHYIHI